MKKENGYIWKVSNDGEDHVVSCAVQKTLYDVYVDGELAMKVPRQMRNSDEDSEYNLKIGSKWCQFVVYDGVPDVAVDGILQGVEEEMRHKERRNRLLLFFGGIGVTAASCFATFLWYAFKVSGEPIFGGLLSLIFIQIFVLGGIAMVFASFRKKKY